MKYFNKINHVILLPINAPTSIPVFFKASVLYMAEQLFMQFITVPWLHAKFLVCYDCITSLIQGGFNKTVLFYSVHKLGWISLSLSIGPVLCKTPQIHCLSVKILVVEEVSSYPSNDLCYTAQRFLNIG